jgi:uncharacterized membrane protein YphA (DoxX/SURF4 family)
MPEFVAPPEVPTGPAVAETKITPVVVPAPVAAPAPPAPETEPEPVPEPPAESDAATRQAEREARERRLGTVPPPADDVEIPEPVKSDNDRFAGSFGLFVLRLVVAAVVMVRGVQIVLDIPGTTDQLAELGAPKPQVFAYCLGVGLIVAAVMCVFGFGARFAGVLIAAYAILMLTFVRWGPFNIFLEGAEGFIGDFELLLAGVGIALVFLGAGGWSIDGKIRSDRAKKKLYE